MKKLIVIGFAALLYFNWHTVTPYLNLPASTAGHGDLASAEVVLFATSWCGYCAKTRKFLAERGIPYTEYDIERSEEGKQRYQALGVSGVPVLLVNGNLVRGYSPAQILANL